MKHADESIHFQLKMENDFNRKIKPSRYILFKKILNTTENMLYNLCPKLVKQSRKIIDTSESDSDDELQNNENNETQENDQEIENNSSDSTKNDINEILNSEICLYNDRSDVSDED